MSGFKSNAERWAHTSKIGIATMACKGLKDVKDSPHMSDKAKTAWAEAHTKLQIFIAEVRRTSTDKGQENLNADS